jgi:hypothetical protein
MLKIITGETGYGKTFFALNEAKKKGKIFNKIETRQLSKKHLNNIK